MTTIPQLGDNHDDQKRDTEASAPSFMDGLLSQHRKKLRNSAISDAVAAARGCRSVTTKRALKDLGFSDGQQIVPSLVIPLKSVLGETVNYQNRPDTPRVIDGRTAKYELPRKSAMRLDINPLMRPLLGNPDVPLLISEGILKGDAAASIGLCCLVLLGVWCFRGKNEFGAVTALGDWEAVALKGRKTIIAFDSDVMLKHQVYAALVRLKRFLETKGADVSVIYLPSRDGGTKTGLDDYIAAGHGRDDVLALATKELRRPEGSEDANERHPYIERPEGIYLLKWTDGPDASPVAEQLTTFLAKVVEEIVEDDGAAQRLLFRVQVPQGDGVVELDIPPREFEEMHWAAEKVGAAAMVLPGVAKRDHARAGILLLSGKPPRRRVFKHTGWTAINGVSVYLHGGGGIGPDGAVEGVEVSLPDSLKAFDIPLPANDEALLTAVRASLATLDPVVIDDEVSFPPYMAMTGAPLGAADHTVFLKGETGGGKSEVAALNQQHYGAGFHAKALPTGFTSTANSREMLLHAAKDAVVVVDDYRPGGDSGSLSDRAEREADQTLRSVGNGNSRGRLDKNLNQRPDRPPRCTLIATGEAVPRGASLRARMVIVEVRLGAVRVAKLTPLQAAAREGVYANAMAGYIQHLANKISDLRAQLPTEMAELRTKLTADGLHARTPVAFASLLVGFRHWLKWAEEIQAITAQERESYWARAQAVLSAIAAHQAHSQAAADPVDRVIRLLRAALTNGDAHLLASSGVGPPPQPASWGWQETMVVFKGVESDEINPRGKTIGWLTKEGVALDADAFFAVVQKIARDQGEAISFSLDQILSAMHDRGLVKVDRRGSKLRYRCRVTIGRDRKYVVLIPISALRDVPDAAPSGPADNDLSADQDGWVDL